MSNGKTFMAAMAALGIMAAVSGAVYEQMRHKKEKLAALSAEEKRLSGGPAGAENAMDKVLAAARREVRLLERVRRARTVFKSGPVAPGALPLLEKLMENFGVKIVHLRLEPPSKPARAASARVTDADGKRAAERVFLRVEADYQNIARLMEGIQGADMPVSLASLDVSSGGVYPPARLTADIALDIYQ